MKPREFFDVLKELRTEGWTARIEQWQHPRDASLKKHIIRLCAPGAETFFDCPITAVHFSTFDQEEYGLTRAAKRLGLSKTFQDTVVFAADDMCSCDQHVRKMRKVLLNILGL